MANEPRLRVVFFRTETGREPVREWLTVRAGEMTLLHGFVKRSQKMPQQDLELARTRKNLWLNG